MNRSVDADNHGDVAALERIAWQVIEATPDALVVVDEDGIIEFVNRQAESMFGYDRAELSGQAVEVLIPERFAAAHTVHRHGYREGPEVRSMGHGRELLARRRDGSEFAAEISLSPLVSPDGVRVVAAVRDISERVAAEARNEEVRRVLDAVEDGVFMFDAETLQFTYVNHGAVEQVGYSQAELLAMGPVQLKPAYDEPAFRELLAPLLTGEVESIHFETLHRRRDGHDLPVEIVLQSPPTPALSRRVCVALVRDIRDRVQHESDLFDAREQASVLAERDRIARDMHDRVIGRLFGIGMALQGTASLAAAPAASTSAVAERLERLTEEIDETLREIRATVYGLRSRSDWGRGVRGSVLAIAADQRSILGFEPEVDFTGSIDELSSDVVDELLATLRESLTNIAKYAEANTVSIAVLSDHGHVQLVVADDGVGFADPGVHVMGNGHGTTGRGLRNMSSRAQALGGRLVVTSAPGDGTTIDWRVPTEHA